MMMTNPVLAAWHATLHFFLRWTSSGKHCSCLVCCKIICLQKYLPPFCIVKFLRQNKKYMQTLSLPYNEIQCYYQLWEQLQTLSVINRMHKEICTILCEYNLVFQNALHRFVGSTSCDDQNTTKQHRVFTGLLMFPPFVMIDYARFRSLQAGEKRLAKVLQSFRKRAASSKV